MVLIRNDDSPLRGQGLPATASAVLKSEEGNFQGYLG